jgi:hypothetical protein
MFEGIVRGYKGFGMGSGFGSVIVEVDQDVDLPAAGCFREVGAITRNDGLVSERAVEVIGDWRPIRDIAEGLRDQRVLVGLDEMGLFPVFRYAED